MAVPLVTIAVFWLVIAYYFVQRIITAHFSPLAKIPPAHPLARYTSLWVSWLRYKRTVLRTIQPAHDEYGPVVRLGPNELSVNCIEHGTKVVYGTRVFTKHEESYSMFRNFGANTMTTAFDNRLHAVHRKRPSNLYTKSFFMKNEDFLAVVAEIVQNKFLHVILNNSGDRGPFDVMTVMRAVSMDLWTGYVFGLRHCSRFLSDLEASKRFYRLVTLSRPPERTYWITELPQVTEVLAKLGIPWFPKSAMEASDEVDAWCLRMMDNVANEKRQIECGVKPAYRTGEKPVVYNQYRGAIVNEGISSEENCMEYTSLPQSMPRKFKADEETLNRKRSPVDVALASEIMDSTLAINHVFPVLPVYACWFISRHPNVQATLMKELRDASQESNGTFKLPDPDTIDSLPYLDAVLNETLRVGAPNAGQELRVTPHGQKTRLGPFEDIPGGVVVSSNPWSLHRQAEVFPDPEVWDPERWFPQSTARHGNGEQQKWLWSFSYGPRGCAGKALGVFMAKSILANLYSNFETKMDAEVDMSPEGNIIVAPKAKELKLHFIKLRSESEEQ